MANLELAMKYEGHTVAEGVDVTATFTGLGANVYVYKFVAEGLPMDSWMDEFDFSFETDIEVLDTIEEF
jgi:hypothetical protein